MKVVFIGPDPQIVEMVGLSLSLRWPATSPLVATSFEEGVELLERTEADVVILQSDLPDESLAKALLKIRSFSNAPALVLGRQGNETELITALEMGADDYVRLPFDLTALVARVWALLRRATANDYQEGESPIRSGELFINPSTYEVFLGNKEVPLTSTEFTLLYLLAQKRGSVVSHQTLGRSLWGEEVDSSGLVKKKPREGMSGGVGAWAPSPNWRTRCARLRPARSSPLPGGLPWRRPSDAQDVPCSRPLEKRWHVRRDHRGARATALPCRSPVPPRTRVHGDLDRHRWSRTCQSPRPSRRSAELCGRGTSGSAPPPVGGRSEDTARRSARIVEGWATSWRAPQRTSLQGSIQRRSQVF